MFLLPVLLVPSLWLSTDGSVRGVQSTRLMPGVQTERGPTGAVVYNFDGQQSGLALSDMPCLEYARSLTVSAWVWMRKTPGHAGQIVFRGDDRLGNDPFQLVTWADGTVHFGITDMDNQGEEVGTEMPTGRWTHVVGTLDDKTGSMRLYIDGAMVKEKKTKLRPIVSLDPGTAPGIGIGNIQNPGFSNHNQPFVGKLADVRVYPLALSPREVGFNPEGWNVPYRCGVEWDGR